MKKKKKNVWAGAPSCYLKLLDELQKWICRTVGPSLAKSLETLVHCWNVASLSLSCKDYCGRSSSELAQLVPPPYFWRRSTHYCDRLHDIFVTILRCYKDACVNSFFPRTARFCNSLPTECFPSTYDLNVLKSRMNRHLLVIGRFFLKRFPVCLNVFVSFSCSSCLVVDVQPCMEWIPIKKSFTISYVKWQLKSEYRWLIDNLVGKGKWR